MDLCATLRLAAPRWSGPVVVVIWRWWGKGGCYSLALTA